MKTIKKSIVAGIAAVGLLAGSCAQDHLCPAYVHKSDQKKDKTMTVVNHPVTDQQVYASAI